MLTCGMLCSLLTALVVGGLGWLGRSRGWTESLASACVKSAVLWMLVLFGTLPMVGGSGGEWMQAFACSMLFALFSAIAAIAIAILGPVPKPLSQEGPGLSPGEE